MNPVFADTAYFLAVVNRTDEVHGAARQIHLADFSSVVTTEFVLLELGGSLSSRALRPIFLTILTRLRSNPKVQVVAASSELFGHGLALFRRRMDKNWTLTDCTSFVVMRQLRITEALTTDHHFEQAGFKALLR